MRLAIATENGMVSAHFGHCETFTLVDIEEDSVVNTAAIPAPPHEPGLLPPFLAEKGANIVIAGGMGPRAVDLFSAQGIQVIPGIQGSIDDVVQAFIAQELKPGSNLCGSKGGDCDGDHDGGGGPNCSH